MEPVLDQIGDLFRRAGGHEVTARSGEVPQQLPQRRPLASYQANDHFGAAARGFHPVRIGEVLRSQWLVQFEMREVMAAEATRQSLAPHLRITEIVQLARQTL